MRVECPCGTLLKHTGNPSDQFADFLPNTLDDAYCEAVESAVAEHDERDVAVQYLIYNTTDLFRRMCQCPVCGRVFIHDENYQAHEFVPANESVPKNLLSGSRRIKG
jgi:hypothetical protein